ncbi:glycosyltransferase family 4 protein [Billgrantia diversa]|uniref:glycosyltransferase family 4 protein n=1 Tax=Halomonas sp. MCCC 1A13316 TaxID=2733487 RepID=UPI0018A64806|nr:glycosyltransferase family 4 protein [Halomonas sp. MCCC 1A13316]QOR39288.1 glycosyltransferase family 4 protein [Halomonas sp. MCCC 1A13316]
MKFLIVAGASGSLINFRGPLIKDLIASGLEVHAAAPDLSKDVLTHTKLEQIGAKAHDVYISRTGINPFHDIRTLVELVRLMWVIKPDYVMGYTIKPVIFGTFAAVLIRCPRRFALITGLGYCFSSYGQTAKTRFIGSIAAKLYRHSLRFSNKVFFQNPDDQALFRDRNIINESVPSVVVNGSGVDIDHYMPCAYPRKVVFLLIARLLIDKGVREYAKAAYNLKTKYPEVVFTLVGDLDSNPNSITAQELDRWVQDGVIDYLGKLDDVRDALSNASVFVLPSFYREGIPRTILEALSMGRPIITTDTPGCRETVVDQENGYLVPPRAAPELANAMRAFIESPQLIATMGKRSREHALRKYDVRKVNAIMLKEMGISCSSVSSISVLPRSC